MSNTELIFFQNTAAIQCCSFSHSAFVLHPVDIDVGLESTSYQVAENFGEVKVCVTLQRVSNSCAIAFPFSVNLSTTDGSAGIKQ